MDYGVSEVEKMGGRIDDRGTNQVFCFGKIRFKVTISDPVKMPCKQLGMSLELQLRFLACDRNLRLIQM